MATCAYCTLPLGPDDRWRALRCEHHLIHRRCWSRQVRGSSIGAPARCPGCKQLADGIINTKSREVLMQPGTSAADKWVGLAIAVLIFTFFVGSIIAVHHMWMMAVFHAMGPMSNATVQRIAGAIYLVCAQLGIVHGTEPSATFVWVIDVVLPLTAAIFHFVAFTAIGAIVIVSMSRDHEPGKKKK